MSERVIVVRETSPAWRILRVAAVGAVAALGLAAVAGAGVLVARDQMARHQSDLFSPHPLRRLAALGYLRAHPDVNSVLLLRDYLAWEERPMLRKRAAAVLAGMEEELAAGESVEEA
jgi:hypothetical protein